jgi:N-acetylglucosamine kinase-like BadF-type ATPase
VLIAGTGSIAYGRDAHGHARARADGVTCSAMKGRGFWLGRQAIRGGACARSIIAARRRRWPRRSWRTSASRARRISCGRFTTRACGPRAIAAVAPIVGEAADHGDAVATRIVDVGAGELAGSAISVAKRLRSCAHAIALPLAGGIFRSVPRVRSLVARASQ